MLTRRNWLRNAAGLLVAAPMVVRADSLMKVIPCTLVSTGGTWRLSTARGEVFRVSMIGDLSQEISIVHNDRTLWRFSYYQPPGGQRC
jgi:hypothetical protein